MSSITGRRSHSRWRLALVMVAAFLGGIYVLVPPLSRTAAFRTRVQSTLGSATGYDVGLATVAVGYDLSLTVGGVTVAVPQQPPFLRARQLTLPVFPWMLFTRHLVAVVDEPHLFVDHLPPSPPGGEPGALPVGGLRIANGFAHYATAQGEVVLGPVSLHVDSLTTAPTFSVRGHSEMALAAVAKQLRLPGIVEGMLETTGQLSGSVHDPQGSGSLQVRGLRWQGDGWMLSGDPNLPFTLGSGATLNLGTPGRSIGAFAGSVRDVAWQVKEAAVSGVVRRQGGELRGQVEIDLADGEFHDAERVRAGEKLRVQGKVEATSPASGAPSLHVDLRLAQGEILWERVYADLAQHRTTVHGELRSATEGVLLRDVVLGAGGIGSVTLNGTVDPGGGRSAVRARLDVSGLSELYTLAVRDPRQEQYPFLARTDVGGALRGDFEYRGSGRDWSVTGDIYLKDGHAVATDPALEFHGLGIDLPIAVGTNVRGAPARPGSLRVTRLRLGGVEIPEIDASLRVVPNAVRLAGPLSVRVLDGTFVLNELEVAHLAGPQRQATLGFAFREIALARLSQALGWPPLQGSMGGNVPTVQIANGEIRSDGEMRAQVFGGQLEMRNLRVKQLTSSVPTLELDVDFENILLARLTEALEIGSISGVANGAVHDLAIVRGEPQRFDAWMETVPRSGVAQRISIKAIRQISTLGGAGSDPISQGLLSYFDEYRYAKMGFRCRLENDRFLLHGIERFEDKEYLVVGSFLPPRVNVVSHNQVIAFSEMVRRLRRVTSDHTDGTERSE